MKKDYQIIYEEKPEESAWGIIGRGLSAYNKEKAGEDHFERICFVLKGPGDEIVGGVIAELFWGWLHIDLLWLEEGLRGQGYGGQILVKAEEEARQRGAKKVFLDTFTFQSPEFYLKHGYQVFGELPDFPDGQTRFFFTKQL